MKSTRWLLCGIAVLALSACGGGDDAATSSSLSRSTPTAKLVLKRFQPECGDFLDYASGSLTEEYLQQFYCFAEGPCPVFISDEGSEAVPGLTGSLAPDRVSGTNVQEAGVDEADIVKVDSQGRLYILSGTRLNILQAFPPAQLSSRPLASLDLAATDPGFQAIDLLLDEARQRVVVLGARYAGSKALSVSVMVDVADAAAPRETLRIGVDGYPLEVRRIGQRVHRVSRYDVPRPEWFDQPDDALQAQRSAYLAARNADRSAEAEAIKAQVRAEIGRRVDAAGSAALLPKMIRQVPGQASVQSTLSCDALSYPEVITGMGVALIDSFNLDGSARATAGIINNAYQVYASPSNLYLAQNSAGWFFAPDQREETVVYRMALSDTGAAEYRGLGKLPGSIKDRYSLSEHQGYLRVASTEASFSGSQTTTRNGLRVLDARGSGDMPLVGGVEDLAPGERIQGVRLLGDRGFIVTFRQIDPLFALDLSDPRRPLVSSELKIPGFSSYLMPIGEDYLLTVGRSGNDEGLDGAVAVQLFDVSDLAKVRSLANLAPDVGVSDYSYSAAEHDPHAFSYFADTAASAAPGTLTIPLTSYGGSPQNSFTGFLVIRVEPGTATPLREIGRIDHQGFLSAQDFCAASPNPENFCSQAYAFAEPRRAVYMQQGEDRFLYTLSSLGVLANSARDPALNLGSRALPYDPPCFSFSPCTSVDF